MTKVVRARKATSFVPRIAALSRQVPFTEESITGPTINEIYMSLAENISEECETREMVEIARHGGTRGLGFITDNNQKLGFIIDINDLFVYISPRTAILISNQSYRIDQLVRLNEVPSSNDWNGKCSRRATNMTANTNVNNALRNILQRRGFTEGEFFIDMAGMSRWVFPGIIVQEKHSANPFSFNPVTVVTVASEHIPKGLDIISQLRTALRESGECAGLNIYMVEIDQENIRRIGALAVAGAAGSVAAFKRFPVLTGQAAVRFVSAFSKSATAVPLVAGGRVAVYIPVVGWVLGAGIITASAVMAVNASRLDSIMILDGPYRI